MPEFAQLVACARLLPWLVGSGTPASLLLPHCCLGVSSPSLNCLLNLWGMGLHPHAGKDWAATDCYSLGSHDPFQMPPSFSRMRLCFRDPWPSG